MVSFSGTPSFVRRYGRRVAVILFLSLLISSLALLFAPFTWAVYFYAGDWMAGTALDDGAISAFFIARFLKRRFWEIPLPCCDLEGCGSKAPGGDGASSSNGWFH